MSHTIKLWEMIIEHHLMGVTNVTKNQFIWLYAREIDYGGDFLDKATYGEMYRAKEIPTYGLY
jgi:hypothetical protein